MNLLDLLMDTSIYESKLVVLAEKIDGKFNPDSKATLTFSNRLNQDWVKDGNFSVFNDCQYLAFSKHIFTRGNKQLVRKWAFNVISLHNVLTTYS